MIEVKWDFEGPDLGRAAQAEVELVVRRLQRTLGAAVCFEHGLHPVVRISGKTWDTMEISLQSCPVATADERALAESGICDGSAGGTRRR